MPGRGGGHWRAGTWSGPGRYWSGLGEGGGKDWLRDSGDPFYKSYEHASGGRCRRILSPRLKNLRIPGSYPAGSTQLRRPTRSTPSAPPWAVDFLPALADHLMTAPR